MGYFYFTGREKAHPVSQMLSQIHTTNHITYWLTDWKMRSPPVHEIIIDCSEALMSACIKTFTESNDTNSYISACTDSLLNGSKTPACYIRCDRSHFAKSITGNRILKSTHPKVRTLLKGAIGYMIKCKSIDECETILRHVFTLTKNEYVNDNVKYSKKFLTDLIATHAFDSLDDIQLPENADKESIFKDSIFDDQTNDGKMKTTHQCIIGLWAYTVW